MSLSRWAGRGAASAAVVVCGVAAGMFVQETLAARNAPTPRESWSALAQEHSDSAYDAAMKRFTGRVSPPVRESLRGLPGERTVLAVLTGDDLRGCEDLGRQLRELHRAVPREPGWTMAILVDAAASEEVRRFLRQERVPSLPVLVGEPGAFLEGAAHPGTPAAVVVTPQGLITAGVSHPLRVRNTRSRSFAQELGLAGDAPADLSLAGARRPR